MQKVKTNVLRKCLSLFILLSLTFFLFGCGNKKYVYKGEIYDDSYDYKKDYGYIYLSETNEKVAKFYEEMYLKMTDFNHKKHDVDVDKCHGLFYEGVISDNTFTEEEIFQGYSFLTTCNPKFYWMSFILNDDEGTFSFGISRKYGKASVRKKLEKEIDEGIKKIDKLLKDKTDEFDKIITLTDYIMNNMIYAYDSNGNPSDEHWAHSIIGFFDNHEGVCESYAKTFKLLCDRYNIGNIPVTSEDHIWNLVEYENEWYVFDITFDEKTYTYIGQTEDIYDDESHIYYKDLYKLPENMAKAPFSLGEIELKENGNTIFKSHSITSIMNHFNGGNYEIVMNNADRKLTDFYISTINPNYSSLTFSSNQTDDNKMRLYITDDIPLTKDVTFKNVNFRANKKVTITTSETIYVKGIDLTGLITVEGNVVYLD